MFPLLTSGHPVNLFDELYSVRGFVEQNYTMRVINLKKLAYAGVLHYLLMRISVGFIIFHFRKKIDHNSIKKNALSFSHDREV